MSKEQTVWYSLTFSVPRNAADATTEALAIIDPAGTEVDSLNKKDDTHIDVRAYFDEQPDPEDVFEVVRRSLGHAGVDVRELKQPAVEEVVKEDWLHEWKKHWKPTEVGRFVIAPPWENYENEEKFVINIEPSMAFGTGTHETTKLCLEFIDEHFQSQFSFLDIGTGTGILTIAAGKLAGAPDSRFAACDTDHDSVKIAVQNALDNEVGFAEFEIGSVQLYEKQKFDFVCANMTIDIIRPMVEQLFQLSGRYLIISGILVEQESELLRLIPNKYQDRALIKREGEWIAAMFEITD